MVDSAPVTIESRFWCADCADYAGSGCDAHSVRRVGCDVSVDICVTDRRHELDGGRFSYFNMVGHMEGRTTTEQQAHTKRRIEEMRKADMAAKRERRINSKLRDNPRRTGAIPMAKLFALKRQFGNDYTQAAVELMKREGTYWGDE